MSSANTPDFLVHKEGDSVAVATRDLTPGSSEGAYLAGQESITVEVKEPIPLGHKFALRDIGENEEVIEYGVCIARASTAISTGEHAHVHNLRSVRWHNSRAS